MTPRRAGSTVQLSFAALLVAELGDKTMLATAALAVREEPLLTWLGGTAGFVLADALAIVVGMVLLRRLPVRAVRLGTAAPLALLGVVLLAGLLQGWRTSRPVGWQRGCRTEQWNDLCAFCGRD